MKRTFDITDHTADVGIIAYGASLEELFSNAATALFSIITEPQKIERKVRFDVQVTSQDRESLLVEWLNELIYLFDVEHVLLNRFDIESLTDCELRAACYGEGLDPVKHKIKTGVKAATYHMLRLDKHGDGYKAQMILDI